MQNKISISGIKKGLAKHIGKKVRVKTNRGRRRIQERNGVIEQIYQNVFTVQTEERGQPGRICFSYSDVLTETVELSICEGITEVNFRDVISGDTIAMP